MHSLPLELIALSSIFLVTVTSLQNLPNDQVIEGRQVIGDYVLYRNLSKWQEAVDICHGEAMQLVDIDTADKDLELLNLLTENGISDIIWTCGRKYQGEFRWTELNNKTFTYTRWYAGEPNEINVKICVHFQAQGGWYDTNCDVTSGTLCQLPTP
ncbi:hypothetical protein B566_EDAN006114 [Ephemera danica]|nr:hypothetical protein B566_EDAN006114 [Ephemera danica]